MLKSPKQLIEGSNALADGPNQLINGFGALLEGLKQLIDGYKTLIHYIGDKLVRDVLSCIFAQIYNSTHPWRAYHQYNELHRQPS